MPNWCFNKLTIKGPPEDIEAFRKKVMRDVVQEDGSSKLIEFSFEGICPRPRELDVEEGSRGDMGYAALYGNPDLILTYKHIKDLGIKTRDDLLEHLRKEHPDYLEIGEQYKRNLDQFGVKSWYDWNCRNWGTKWDADFHGFEQPNARTLKYWFDTAWSPPEPWVETAHEQFPILTFKLDYTLEGESGKFTFMLEGEPRPKTRKKQNA
jgi:hypothetical protein